MKTLVNKANKAGDTPLILACRQKNFEICKLLLERNGDPNATNKAGQGTFYSAVNGNEKVCVKIAQLLMKYKFDFKNLINKGDTNNYYALHGAVKNMYCLKYCFEIEKEIIKTDSSFKINIFIKTNAGYTLLHHCALIRANEAFKYILNKFEERCDNMDTFVNKTDSINRTVLHYCAMKGTLENMIVLTKYKIDINLRDKQGFSALHVACNRNNLDCVKWLLNNKLCNVNIQDTKNQTPLTKAIFQGMLCMCFMWYVVSVVSILFLPKLLGGFNPFEIKILPFTFKIFENVQGGGQHYTNGCMFFPCMGLR